MNETLKFSWGHIVAFMALIAVCYVSFVGYTYLSAGNFFFSIAATVLTAIVYSLIFFSVQIFKASGNKIEKKIIWERVVIFVSPFLFAGCMVGIAHFWTVKTQDREIVESFKNSINNSKQMFSDYENYSHQRIKNYNSDLSKIISLKHANPALYSQAGFINGDEKAQQAYMVRTLELQLLSENYTNLKDAATKWIDESNQGASTWNVFLIGNTREIKKAVEKWQEQLQEMAAPRLTNEGLITQVEQFTSGGAGSAVSGLDFMSDTYKKWKYPVWEVFFFGAILYFLLLVPYLMQQRHGRQVASGYTLWKTKQRKHILSEKRNSHAHDNKSMDTRSVEEENPNVKGRSIKSQKNLEPSKEEVENNDEFSIHEDNSQDIFKKKLEEFKRGNKKT